MESNRVVVAFERRQTRAKGGMTDVGNIPTPVDARVADEETRARPRSRAIDGGDTKSPNDGVDASNREDDERNAVVGTCRVCLEDITREDVEMKTVVSLGCACVSSGRVHDSAECRDAYVAAKRAAGECACEICLRPLSAAFTSLERSKRALVVDIDVIDRSGRATVRDARRGVARNQSLDAAESGGFARVRVRATRERVRAPPHRSRRAHVRESRSTDVTRVDGEKRARPAVRFADFAPEGNDGARPHSRRHSSTTTSPAS